MGCFTKNPYHHNILLPLLIKICLFLKIIMFCWFWMKLQTFYSKKRFELSEKIFSVIKGNNFHSSEEILITPFITRATPPLSYRPFLFSLINLGTRRATSVTKYFPLLQFLENTRELTPLLLPSFFFFLD